MGEYGYKKLLVWQKADELAYNTEPMTLNLKLMTLFMVG